MIKFDFLKNKRNNILWSIIFFIFILIFCVMVINKESVLAKSEGYLADVSKSDNHLNLSIKDFLSKAKKQEGLLNVFYYKNQYVIELPKEKLNRLFYSYLSVSKGMAVYPLLGGLTLPIFSFTDYSVAIYFDMDKDIELKDNKQVKLYLKLKNIKYRTDSIQDWSNKLLEKSYTDSLISVLDATYYNNNFYINADNFLKIDLLGSVSKYFENIKVKPFKVESISTYPLNINTKISYLVSYSDPNMFDYLNSIDNNIVEINWGIFVNDNKDYQRREYDKRVGYFATTYADVSSLKAQDGYRTIKRYINRWDLSNGKKVVYYIENTFPKQYREAVKEGILEWNKAFNKIGYNNPIEVKEQEDNANWEPEDLRYHTIRYQDSVNSAFAIGPSISDPITGEIVDADIVFYAPMLRIINSSYDIIWDVFVNESLKAQYDPFYKLYYNLIFNKNNLDILEFLKELNGAIENIEALKSNEIYKNTCLYSLDKTEYAVLALSVIAMDNPLNYSNLREKLVKDYIKDVIIHEVGHTLGLRHNFKASSFVSKDQLLDENYTSKNGICYSCMDYNPANLHFKNNKPYYTNDIFMTTIGYYDYLAIEYGYKETDSIELSKIAKEAGKYYGPDEDLFSLDPNIRQYDLSSDTLGYDYEYKLINKYILNNSVYKLSKSGRSYDIIYLANVNAIRRILLTQIEDLFYWNFGKNISRSFVGDVDYPPVKYIDIKEVYKLNNLTIAEILSKDPLIDKAVIENSIWLGDYEWGSRSYFTQTILGNAYLTDRLYRLISLLMLIMPNIYSTEREYYENISINKRNLYNLYYSLFKDFDGKKELSNIKKQTIEDFIYLLSLMLGYNDKQVGTLHHIALAIISSPNYRDSIFDIMLKIENKLDSVINDKNAMEGNKLFAKRLRKYLKLSFDSN